MALYIENNEGTEDYEPYHKICSEMSKARQNPQALKLENGQKAITS